MKKTIDPLDVVRTLHRVGFATMCAGKGEHNPGPRNPCPCPRPKSLQTLCTYSATERALLESVGLDVATLECGFYERMETTYVFCESPPPSDDVIRLAATAHRLRPEFIASLWELFRGKTVTEYVLERVVGELLRAEFPLEPPTQSPEGGLEGVWELDTVWPVVVVGLAAAGYAYYRRRSAGLG
jgi:hypothetical protein